MAPATLRERLSELAGRVDAERYVDALRYVHDDGRRDRRRSR